MDCTTGPRPALPPISFFDINKIKREEAEYQGRNTDMTAHTAVTTRASSPYQYPVGPPPPYSNPAPVLASALPPVISTRSPPQAHAMLSEEENDADDQHTKQSLPSIHEALGVEQPAAYLPQPTYSSQPAYKPTVISSPIPPSRSSFSMESLQGPPNPFSHPQQSYMRYQRPSSPRTDLDMGERLRNDYSKSASYQMPLPPLQPARAAHSPVQSSARAAPPPFAPAASSSLYDPLPQQSAAVPPRTFPYGYAPYPPQYAYATPPTSVTHSIYQPSVTQPAPPQNPSSWRAEKAGAELSGESTRSRPGSAYGESVKRHLDLFDFESALNEVAEHGAVMSDFSRLYGARLHQTQRTGPVPGTLPAMTEVDELMNKTRHTLDALGRMRAVLAEQQAVFYQQAQEQQRYRAESDAKRNDSVHQSEDAKAGGFAGGDAKKRRGRAAAPGRCHSCNRAETPEWRRGPDGARTLCNACGLHYAKLTRKAGANKGTAPNTGSNLRPKSHDEDDD